MNRVAHALWLVACFLMGALLLYLPWMQLWERNYFLSRFPRLLPVMLHPSVRGAVSGLGVLDMVLAMRMIRWRQPARETRD